MRRSTFIAAVLLAAACLTAPAVPVRAGVSAAETAEGFKSIFNGRDLDGWDGDPKFWSVEDGAITARSTPENPCRRNSFIVWRQGEVDNFELRLSFKIAGEGANSGIQYRSREIERWTIAGYQADIDVEGKFIGCLYDEHGRGMLAERGQKAKAREDGRLETQPYEDPIVLLDHVRKGEWNDYSISAFGNRLVQRINGMITAECDDFDPRHADFAGLLALQLHEGPPSLVQFKDIRLRRIPLEGRRKIVLVAGEPSHNYGDHEFTAGVSALRKCLDKLPGVIAADYYGGWPADPTAFDNADAVVLYMDGGGGHPAIQGDRLAELAALMKKGAGLACFHYAVEVPAERGGAEFKDWIGGYYETGYSINPVWEADFAALPEHPITRGVQPFKIRDEWYYNIRFRDGMDGVVPILTATPPNLTRKTEAAKAHPDRPEVTAWAVERPDGGRGFGFTGGHYHRNWGDANFRKLALNAILWTAGAEVPAAGVESAPSEAELNGRLRKNEKQEAQKNKDGRP